MASASRTITGNCSGQSLRFQIPAKERRIGPQQRVERELRGAVERVASKWRLARDERGAGGVERACGHAPPDPA